VEALDGEELRHHLAEVGVVFDDQDRAGFGQAPYYSDSASRRRRLFSAEPKQAQLQTAIILVIISPSIGMHVARRFLINGRVQGVGFRYFTYTIAGREGLSGWVRNRPDGRVEIRAEGDRAALDRFEREVRSGPPGSRVDEVTSDDRPLTNEEGFEIR